MTKTQVMADSRDMIVIHAMLRREFGAVPDLVRAVPGGDRVQVAVVADHVAWMVSFLHAHLESEDQLLWPTLLDRLPAGSDAVIHTMAVQHLDLVRALGRVAATTFAWRTSSSVQDRSIVVEETGDLLWRITEHLDLEERCVSPLIDAHLTDKEWKTVAEEGFTGLSFGQRQFAFGAIRYDAPPASAAVLRHAMPLPGRLLFSVLAPRAYRKHVERLGGAHPGVPVDGTSARTPMTTPSPDAGRPAVA